MSPFMFPDKNSFGKKIGVFCTSNDDSSLSWLKDGKTIYDGDLFSINELDGALRLLIPSITADHAGNYTCVSRNGYGSDSYSAVLSVVSPPIWLTTLKDIAMSNDKSVTLNCNATGHPKPTVHWTRDGGMR